jgi:AcrR family transcriptional regulator
VTDAVADRVLRAIGRTGESRRGFAAAIGLDETKLSKSLAGRRRFTTDELAAIAARAGMPLAELVGPAVTAEPGPAVRPRPAADDPDGARRRILDAAWTLIAERGYHQVRVADVAAAAGTSSAAVHYHFPGKDALLGDALRHNVELAFDRQSAALADLPDPHARLLRLLELQMPEGPVLEPEWSIWMQVWVEAVLDGAEDHPRRALYREAQDRWFRTVLLTLQDGVAAGVFRPGDQELRARQLTALVDGLGIGVMTRAGTPADMRAALHDVVETTICRGDHR